MTTSPPTTKAAMRSLYWDFVKNIADTGTWGKAHAALTLLFPAAFALAALFPDPPLWLYVSGCTLLSPLARNAVMFPVATILMDRRRTRQFAG